MRKGKGFLFFVKIVCIHTEKVFLASLKKLKGHHEKEFQENLYRNLIQQLIQTLIRLMQSEKILTE